MADYQRIVEYLRDIRAALPAQISEELRQYAAQYAELCAQANERLRQCSTFLQQGLRSEAIHLAEEPPNLLDLVAALDLPDPEGWAEYCRNYDLAVPPALQMERAAQLNEAYNADQPLEALLNQHRLLALSRGPMRERLNVLRQIAARDAASAFWEKDVRTFERARLRELPAAFLQAVKTRDMEAISGLYDEIVSTPWLESVPADLAAGVTEAFSRMRQARAEGMMRDMLPSLQAAYGARDLLECVRLLQQWKEIMDVEGLKGVSPDLAAQVEPITGWVKQQGEQQAREKKLAAAINSLRQRIEDKAPEPDLAAAERKILAQGSEVPDEVKQPLAALRAARAAAMKKRRRVRLLTAGGLAAVLVLAAAGGVFWVLRSQGAAAWASRIRAANEARDLARADQLLGELPPTLKRAAEVQAAAGETESLHRQQEQDQRRLRDLLAALGPATLRARQAAEAGQPEALLRAAGEVKGTLDRVAGAGDLTWVDRNHELASAREGLVQAEQALRQKAGALVRQRAESLGQQIQAVEGGIPESLRQLNSLAGQAQELAELPGLEETAHQAAERVAAAARQRQQALTTAQQQQQDYRALAAKAGNPEALQQALMAFAENYPGHPAAGDFKAAAELAGAAGAVEPWRALVQQWAGGKPFRIAPATTAVAQQRLADVEAYIKNHPESPLIPAAQQYSLYLAQASGALAEKGTWQQAFKDLLDKPMITDLAYMESTDGTRYYVLGDIHKVERRVNDRTAVTFEALDPSNFAKRRTISIDSPFRLTTEKPVRTAHAKFAATLADQLKLVDERNWETFGIDLAERLAKEREMDLVLRATFLEIAIKTTEQLDGWALGDLYAKTLRDLARQEVDKIVWYDPDHPVSEGTRQALEGIFEAMPKGDAVRKMLAAAEGRLQEQVAFVPLAMGLLLKNDEGQWQIAGTPVGPEGSVAWGVAAGGGKQAALMRMGIVVRGQWVLDGAALSRLYQGTPVFVTRP